LDHIIVEYANMNTLLPFNATLTETSDHRGISIVVINTSDQAIAVQFPNPYTGVNLYEKGGKRVLIGRTLLCYDENDPERVLEPGQTVAAIVALDPYWENIDGDVIAKCKLRFKGVSGTQSEAIVEGIIHLKLPSGEWFRKVANSFDGTTRRANVSAHVRLVD